MSAILAAGAALRPGDSRTSPNRKYLLSYQADGNLVLRAESAVLWSSGTQGLGAGACTMQAEDGRLVIQDAHGKPLWKTAQSHSSYAGSQLVLSDDGGLAIVRPDGKALWCPISCASRISIGETLAPGTSRVSPNRHHTLTYQADGDLVLYTKGQPIWSTDTRGHSPGACMLQASDGQLVISAADHSHLWATYVSGLGCMDSWVELTNSGRLIQSRPDGQVLWSRGRTVELRYLICINAQEGAAPNPRDSGDEIFLKVNSATVWASQDNCQPSMTKLTDTSGEHDALLSHIKSGQRGWQLVRAPAMESYSHRSPRAIRSLSGLRFPNVSLRSPLSIEVWEADGGFFAGDDDYFGSFIIDGTEDDFEGLGNNWYAGAVFEDGERGAQKMELRICKRHPGACYMLLYSVT